MPVVSEFFGIKIKMNFSDVGQHNVPHIHAEYQNDKASISISDGELLAGKLPPKKLRLVQAWIEIHQDELKSCWNQAVSNEHPNRINPLQ